VVLKAVSAVLWEGKYSTSEDYYGPVSARLFSNEEGTFLIGNRKDDDGDWLWLVDLTEQVPDCCPTIPPDGRVDSRMISRLTIG
jgi:hypothetical protein